MINNDSNSNTDTDTDTNANSTIISRLKKLLALSESQNEHEATLAAEHAARLMERHNITRSMIDFITDQDQTVTEGVVDDRHSRIVNWKGSLCQAAGYVTRCKMYYNYNGAITAIGTKQDIKDCKEFYELLIDRVNSTCDYMYAEVGLFSNDHAKAWKNSFKLGMVREIKSRLYQQHKDSLKRLNEGTYLDTPSENSTALMVVNNKLARVEQYVRDNLTLKSAPSARLSSQSAYECGRAEGKKANLSKKNVKRLN